MHEARESEAKVFPCNGYLSMHSIYKSSLHLSIKNSITKNTNSSLRIPIDHHRIQSIQARSINMGAATTFYDFKPVDKKGNEVALADYKGKVVLVVNTASKCGFTPQYEGLEKLYKKIREKHGDNFQILGFPSNQFGSQEPGSNDDIQEFCQVNYGVSFPIMGKTDVNGDKAAPLYDWMKNEQPGLMGLKRVKWNFEKFLISKEGKVVGRWASTTKPESLEKPILEQLAK